MVLTCFARSGPTGSRSGRSEVEERSGGPAMGSANRVNLVEGDAYVTVPESKQLITRFEFSETFFFVGKIFAAVDYQSKSEI